MGEILTPEKFNEALADLAFDRWGDSELRGHDTALRAALAEEKRAHEAALAERDLHWREVESLRERLGKEEEERGRQYGLRVQAEEQAKIAEAAARSVVAEAHSTLRLCDLYCEHLHHDKSTHHKSGMPCPVEAKVNAFLATLAPETKP